MVATVPDLFPGIVKNDAFIVNQRILLDLIIILGGLPDIFRFHQVCPLPPYHLFCFGAWLPLVWSIFFLFITEDNFSVKSGWHYWGLPVGFFSSVTPVTMQALKALMVRAFDRRFGGPACSRKSPAPGRLRTMVRCTGIPYRRDRGCFV